MQKPAGRHSKYWGVTSTTDGRFQAFVKAGSPPKRVHLGQWRDENDAALARDRAVLFFELDAPLNNGRRARAAAAESPADLVWLANHKSRKEGTRSGYRGVAWNAPRGAWEVTVCIGDRRVVKIARFADAECAARAHDRVAQYLLGERAKLNFPGLALAPASITEIRREALAERKAGASSRYRGVCRFRDEWIAQIASGRRHRHLGVYRSEEAAAVAYDSAAREAFGETAVLNFPTALERRVAEAAALNSLLRRQKKGRRRVP